MVYPETMRTLHEASEMWAHDSEYPEVGSCWVHIEYLAGIHCNVHGASLEKSIYTGERI